ncbi:MAG TPA: hypothetical protein VFZ49_10935 [Pyrinomonadaceae bacterium]
MTKGTFFIVFLSLLIGSHTAYSQRYSFAQKAAARAGLTVDDFGSKVCDFKRDPIARRVLREYGSVFVAGADVLVPDKCIFDSRETAERFQKRAKFVREHIGGVEITLQPPAMISLLSAIEEAVAIGVRITPRDGSIAGGRDYDDTIRLWDSRFYRALDYWLARGKITKEEADRARLLAAYEQVPLVLNWESKMIWFSTGFNRSILSSVAAPGTSQHLSGLAFDVTEYSDSRVRLIMNKHGWYQTVLADEPHFTYLGGRETQLAGSGLRLLVSNRYRYWVPID